MFFLPWDLLHTVSAAMGEHGWKPFRQPFVWVCVGKPAYRFSKQPFDGHCLILAFAKDLEHFQVVINEELEVRHGLKSKNLYHNVFAAPQSKYRQKPSASKKSRRKSGSGLVDAEDELAEVTATALSQSPTTPVADTEQVAEATRTVNRFRVEQKPVNLLRMFIRRYAPTEGDIVIDPCFGTGSSGIAALKEKRVFFGMDQDPVAQIVAECWEAEEAKTLKNPVTPSATPAATPSRPVRTGTTTASGPSAAAAGSGKAVMQQSAQVLELFGGESHDDVPVVVAEHLYQQCKGCVEAKLAHPNVCSKTCSLCRVWFCPMHIGLRDFCDNCTEVGSCIVEDYENPWERIGRHKFIKQRVMELNAKRRANMQQPQGKGGGNSIKNPFIDDEAGDDDGDSSGGSSEASTAEGKVVEDLFASEDDLRSDALAARQELHEELQLATRELAHAKTKAELCTEAGTAEAKRNVQKCKEKVLELKQLISRSRAEYPSDEDSSGEDFAAGSQRPAGSSQSPLTPNVPPTQPLSQSQGSVPASQRSTGRGRKRAAEGVSAGEKKTTPKRQKGAK